MVLRLRDKDQRKMTAGRKERILKDKHGFIKSLLLLTNPMK